MGALRDYARAALARPGVMRAFDRATAVALRAGVAPMRVYGHFGPVRLPVSRETLKRGGVYPVRDHYYEPQFNDAHLRRPLSAERYLPGVDLRREEQRAFVRSLAFADELKALGWDRPAASPLDPTVHGLTNFSAGDSDLLYQVIRTMRPRRIVEIGSGDSTKVARAALLRNEADGDEPAEHVCIEPYEMPWLEQLGVRVIRARVQDVGLEPFLALAADDLLFIDSSHVIRPQGDVLFEFLEVLPSLASGIVVHVHDIFTPRDYPDQWVRESVRMWDEQYLLEALLSSSDRYEVLAALNDLKHTAYDDLAAACPYLTPGSEPASFYLRVR